jgi:5'-AMP-activated protein kinase catalytic alpha subunit
MHNNIIQLYCIIETTNTIYIVNEYCGGGELFDYILSKKKLTESESCKIFHQLISGVEYLHNQGIVHRDIKPENLLFDSKRELKIADFGLSNVYRPGQLLSTPCGSPCYAAPEMVQNRKYKGSAVDIWSCGIVLFTMVCGYLPFEEENQEKLFYKIARGLVNYPSFISYACKDLLMNLLQVEPNKRFTFKQIKEHAWFKAGIMNSTKPVIFSPGVNIKTHAIPVSRLLILGRRKNCFDAY